MLAWKRPGVKGAGVFANVVREGMHATVVADSDGGAAAVSFPNATVLRVSPVYGTARLQDDAQRVGHVLNVFLVPYILDTMAPCK